MKAIFLMFGISLLSMEALADIDIACMARCTERGMGRAYCQQACFVSQPEYGGGFAGGWMAGQKHRQESQLRELEIQQKRLELERLRRQLSEGNRERLGPVQPQREQ